MEPTPLTEDQSITYQLSRDELVRTWFKRSLRRPSYIRSQALILIAMILILCSGHGSWNFLIFLGVFMIVYPFFLYRGISKVVAANSQLTDPRQLQFSRAGLIFTGPNWKNEVPWTHYAGFSENSDYFYLQLRATFLVAFIPKSAFSPEQAAQFRECAKGEIIP